MLPVTTIQGEVLDAKCKCGAELTPGWKACPICGTQIITAEDRARNRTLVGVLLMAAGAFLYIMGEAK
jgi:hypothetical protein